MSQLDATLRIGLVTPTFPRSVEHAVEQVEAFVTQAAERRVALMCFPESFVPGMRGIGTEGRLRLKEFWNLGL